MAICIRTLEVCFDDSSISTLLLCKKHEFINLHYDLFLDLVLGTNCQICFYHFIDSTVIGQVRRCLLWCCHLKYGHQNLLWNGNLLLAHIDTLFLTESCVCICSFIYVAHLQEFLCCNLHFNAFPWMQQNGISRENCCAARFTSYCKID